MAIVPAYARVYNILKREILDHDYSTGELLPSEPQLEKRFDVSRTTIRKAIDMLVREKLIKVQQGKGTTILDQKATQQLNRVESVTETLRESGYIITTKSMVIDTLPASARVSDELHLRAGDDVVCVKRVQLADGVPIVIMRNYLPPAIVPNIQNYVNTFSSLYNFLEINYDIHIDSAIDKISAKVADEDEASTLNIQPGSAILFMRRVCYSDNKPVCVDRLSIVGDKYELSVRMVGRG